MGYLPLANGQIRANEGQGYGDGSFDSYGANGGTGTMVQPRYRGSGSPGGGGSNAMRNGWFEKLIVTSGERG